MFKTKELGSSVFHLLKMNFDKLNYKLCFTRIRELLLADQSMFIDECLLLEHGKCVNRSICFWVYL